MKVLALLALITISFACFGISIVFKSINANRYAVADIIVSRAVAATLGYLIFFEIPGRGMIYGGTLLLEPASGWRGREDQPIHSGQGEPACAT